MRLIDADTLQNILLPIITALEHEYGSLGGAVSGCMKHIDNAHTIDAVPVVRCGQCLHWEKGAFQAGDDAEHLQYGGRCPFCKFARYENDFCSYGERKEGAD